MSRALLIAQLSKIAKRWNTLEHKLKRTEQLTEGVVQAAINELRYAGRRVVDAWLVLEKPDPTDADFQEAFELLVVANQYMSNADHDAMDAVTAFLASTIHRLASEIGMDGLARLYPDAKRLDAAIQDAEVKRASSRGDRTQRDAIYASLYEDYWELFTNGIQAIEEIEEQSQFQLLKKEDERKAERERALAAEAKLKRWQAVSIGLGIVAAVMGIIWYTWLFWGLRR
jgi:hypothetical protein